MIDEGYIKFKCNLIKDDPLPMTVLSEIKRWRKKLYQLELIGAYANGIGFGNISIRCGNNNFIISGSATGTIPELDENGYTMVETYDYQHNSLTCRGPVNASSESLSHAAIYECSPRIKAVIHIHHLGMWEQLSDTIPTTEKRVDFGTPEMVEDIKRLFREYNLKEDGIIVMGGHREGIISFGQTLQSAGNTLLDKYVEVMNQA